VLPGTTLLLTSFRVMVILEVATPSATTGDVPMIFELAATAAPAVKTTAPPALTTGVTIDNVLDSALVDLRVQVEIPEAFETEHAPLTLELPVLVAVNVGVKPGVGLFAASFNVIVTVELATPSANTGVVPVIVEFTATGGEAIKDTVAAPVTATGEVNCSVLTSAVNEESVQDESPVTSLALQAP
jgi:hypothetical protein